VATGRVRAPDDGGHGGNLAIRPANAGGKTRINRPGLHSAEIYSNQKPWRLPAASVDVPRSRCRTHGDGLAARRRGLPKLTAVNSADGCRYGSTDAAAIFICR